MGEKCGFGWGLGGREQVGADLNRLQGGKQRTTEDRWREAGRVHVLVCCVFRRRMSPCPSSSSLFLFFWCSPSISHCSLVAVIYRQHFRSSFQQCHKSNLPPLQWITVFQQTQQSNASVPPHSNSPSITDSDIAYSQRHSDTSPLDNSVIILHT